MKSVLKKSELTSIQSSMDEKAPSQAEIIPGPGADNP